MKLLLGTAGVSCVGDRPTRRNGPKLARSGGRVLSQLRDTPEARRTTTPDEIGRIHFPAELKLTERSYRLALRA